MDISVVLVVLGAAHAFWNFQVRSTEDKAWHGCDVWSFTGHWPRLCRAAPTGPGNTFLSVLCCTSAIKCFY